MGLLGGRTQNTDRVVPGWQIGRARKGRVAKRGVCAKTSSDMLSEQGLPKAEKRT